MNINTITISIAFYGKVFFMCYTDIISRLKCDDMYYIRLKTLIIMILMISNVLPVYAQNWKDFIPSDKASGQSIQFDADSKKKISDSINRVWVKMENKEQKELKKGASPVAKTFYLTEINCIESMHRIISTSSYTQDGRIINSSHEPDSAWYFIVPESIVSHLKKAVCDNK